MGGFKTYSKELPLASSEARELIDITSQVADAVKESGVAEGIAVVCSKHTTAAIIVNEDEPGLFNDILTKIAEDFPRRGTWRHNLIDDNAHSHLAAAYLGPSVTIPVVEGSPSLGQWQSIFFVELDGPRPSRRVVVQVMGE